MSRSRGAVSRAASALMFALAGVAAFVFPEGEAGALSAAGGFAPAQVPTQGVLPVERYYASQLQDGYRNPVLCTDLGGTLQEVGGEWVCQGLDGAGTFCIVGSQDVFPCRGLFRHVIQCNDVYNRSALNPFICDGVCQQSGAPWEVKARGPNCEFVIPEEEIIAEADRTVDLPNFPAGYTGVLATLQVSLLTFQGTEYESHTLINDRPLGPGVPEANADQLTISAGNVLEIPEYAPLRAGETQRVLVAKNSCPRLPGQGPRPSFRGSADLGCYPVFVNITANFAQVIERTDIRLLSVAANLPAAAVTLKTAVGHSGLGYDIALTNTMDYALVNIAYDTDAHGFDPDNGIILLDTPLQAGAPITAEIEADIECRTIPFCNPARISVTVVFEPVAAPPQPPASLPETDPFFLSVPITLPGGYVHSEAFTQIPGFEDHLVATLEVVGIDGYAGDTADFVANDGGNLSNENSNVVLPAGDYVFTIQMTADDLLGMILFEISLNIYPEGQIPPDKSIPASERKIFQAVAPGHSGSIAFFRSADAAIGLSTPGPDPADTPPFSTLPGETDVTIFPPDGIVLYYTPDDTNPLPPGETRVLTLSFRSEKMPGSDAVEEDFMVTVTVSIVAVPPQTPLETDTEEDFMHPLVIPGFDLADGEFLVVGVENADDGQPVFDPFFDVVNGILQRRRTGDVPPPVIPGNYIVTVEVTHPDISGPVTMTISVAVRGVLNPAIHNLSAPADPILVAPGYAGNLRLQPPANISLASTAEADVTVTLPESFPAGVSLELSADSREVTPHLADPLVAEEELIAVLSLTLVRGDLYDPLEQLVTVAVSALALPAVASAEVIAFSPQNIFAAGGDIIDLSAADYENGVYNGAIFQKSGVLPELNVRVEGTVFAETDLALGEYQITVVALGRPATSGAQFFGEVAITVSVGAVQGAETIAPDDVVPAVAREVSIDAAVGYAGAGYAVSVADDFELTQESWEETAFDYDADGEVILITTAVGDDPVSYTVIAQANCTAASGRLCDETEITIVANFNPVSAPAQAALNADYLDGFAHSLALPAGYENGGGKDVGRTLTVSGVGGWTGDLAALSLAVNGETLEYAPDGVAENALTPGEYTIALEMTQSELLGTVAFEVAANISPRPLVAADYGVSELPLVTIVPGPNGVGLEIASATLTGGAADAVLAIPDPANFPEKLSLALSADERGFTLFVTAAFTSEEVAEIGVPFIVSRPGGNYAPLDAVASVTVRALRQPDLIEQSAAGIPYTEANLANLKTGVFENATRFTRVDAESDAGLQVDETTGIVSTDGDLGVGTYNLVVDAISPDFFGVIRLSFRLVVSDRPILTPAQTIPSGQRSRQIAAAAGYSGSVAFFVASSVGVTLQTPSTAPAGFNLGGADALNAGFVSPEGFTLFLEADQIPNGGDQAAAEFEIAASLGGHEAETITLNITVLAIAADQPVLIAPESAPDYAHDLTPPAGYSFSPAGTLQIVGVHDTVNDSPVDFAALLTLDESNNLQPVDASDPSARLAVGRYFITVEMTHPNFLGTANLLITADIQEELLPANVVADRDVSQLVVVGHSGEGYEIPVVTAAYTLANAAYDENEFTLALDYELQILNPMPNSDLAATLAADVLCADQTSRSCAPLRISLTITYAPVSHPMLERTERVTVAGDGDEDPYNDPNIAALNTGNFANATFAKVPPPESSVSLLISEGGTISTDGDLFVGAYTLFADATSPDFLGTARASLGLTVRGMLNPAANNNHYGIQGPDVNPLLVAPGYGGDLQELAARVYLRGNAPSRARVVLPSESPAGITLRHGASNAIAVPHLTIALAPEETLVAVLTLTVERDGVDNPELYDKLPQLKTITVSALAFPEPALATVAARPAPVNTFAADEIIVSLDTNAYADGFYSSARFVEHADASPDLNVGQDIGQSGGVSAQRDLAVGAYEFTVLARGDTGALHNTSHPNAQRFFHGTVTIAVSVDIVRGAEIIAPDDYIPAADRDANIDSAVGYSGDGYAIPLASDDYELTDEEWDTAAFDYNAADEVIQITTPIADDPVSYVVTAQASCTEASGRLCAPVAVTITATFTPVSAPGQAGVATMYLDPFIALLDLPDGYKSTDANTKFAGILLSVSGVNGWTGDIADLSLQAANGQLGYSPNGVAEDALTAGQYTITVEMTHPDLLGTVAMDVAANITPRALPLADYGFSEAPVVAVAPGASAVGESIAVFALTGGAADAQVALPDEANFPAKLSLELSADNRGFTVYVSAPFTSGEVAVHNNIPLTVTRPGGNYAPLEVPAALTVGALSQPAPTERSATGVPHNDASIADLKTIGGAVYVNATFEKASGDAELTVNADGVVSTNGDITAAGTYNIAVDATSPDFFGSVRFALQLILTDRSVLLPANTIPTAQRDQTIPVVAGYAGSVAYFVATDEGVTLQTPDPAPTGFNFGANGAGANFVSPVGFTLFVDQLDAGQAVAAFQVSATLAEHEGEDITLNITVAAVPAPAQALLRAVHATSDYEYDLTAPADYPFGGGELRILGARNTVTGESVDDIADRVTLHVGRIPNPVDADDENARLNPGHYVITVAFTHPGFLGEMNLLVTADIGEMLDPDDVVAAAARNVTQPIAVGHSGVGYEIPVEAGYALENHEFNDLVINLDGDELEVIHPRTAGAPDLVVALTADVTCADANRNCRPLKLTLTVTYTFVSAPAQTDANAQYLVAFDHPLALPSGYETGGANSAGRALNITGVNGLADSSKLSLNIDGDNLKYAPNGVAEDALTVGGYTVTVEMTQPNLLGTVTMEVTANITRAQLDPTDYAIPHLGTSIPLPGAFDPRGIPVVAGEGGNDALIGVAALSDATGATIAGFTSRNFVGTLAPDGRAVTIRTRTNANYSSGTEEYANFTLTVTRGNPNYANLLVVVSVGVAAFAPPPLLELSAQGSPTYTSDNIANLLTDAFSHNRYNGAIFTQVGAADTDLNFASDTGIVSGTNLAVGTHTLTVDATFPVAANTRPNFVGFSRAELILTVESAPPTPDSVIADRDVTQPVALGHFGAPGYVIPVDPAYTLENPSYDETQITLTDNNEVRFLAPLPLFPPSILRASLAADVQCVDPSATPACGPLRISVTILFTGVNPGIQLAPLVASVSDPTLDPFPVPMPTGYDAAAATVSLVQTEFTGILRHDGTRVIAFPENAFAISGTDIVQHANGFPDAGAYVINVDITHPGFLGALRSFVAGNIFPDTLRPEFALAETAATVTVVPGFAGVVYQTTLQTSDGVIGSPYVVPPAAPGVAAGLFGDAATLGVVIEDIVGPGAADILATIRATIGNRADPANFQPVGAQLELRIAALPETPATVYTFVRETYNEPAIHDFRTVSPFENATFTEVGNSPELTVTPEGVVGTDGEITSTGTYAITVEATDASAFVGSARLTLSLRLVGTDSQATADELLADGTFAPALNVAEGESGEIYRLEVINDYSLDYEPQEANPQLVLDSGTGAISIPTGETMGTAERRVVITATVLCPASGKNPRDITCLTDDLAQTVSIIIAANGVANPAANFAVFYDEPDFAEPIPLPAGYTAADINIVLPPQTGLGLTPDSATLTLDETNYPAARVHLVPVEYAHPAPDLSGAGFWGTLTAAINLNVRQANPPTIPASEIGTGSAPDLRSTVVIGPGVVEATLRAWSGTEGGSPGAAAEFRGPPLAKTEFFNVRYFSELSADRKTLFLSLNPENDTVRNTAASGGAIDFTNLADVTLVGPGDDSANYAAVVQGVHLQLVFRPAPSASPALQETAPLAANSALFNFRADSTGGYDYAADFANAEFAKISGSDELTITPQGVVQNPNQIDIGGNYNIVAQATSDDWAGTARVSLALEVITAQDVLFGGEVLRTPVAGATQTIVLANIEAENIADNPDNPTLYLADMIYHGVWRGLHWVYGEKYLFVDTSGEGTGAATRAAQSDKSADTLETDEWFDFNICAAGGEGWRLPRLSEMVGGLKSGSGGGTEVMAVRGGTPGPLHIRGYPILQQRVRAPYPPATSRDTATAPLPYLNGEHYNSLPVSSADSASSTTQDQPAALRRSTSSGNAVELRDLGSIRSGRAACVLEAGSKTAYDRDQNPREWAIALTESNVPATVAMDNIGENSAVAVGATVHLGVFRERGLATPLTLTADMSADNDGKAADLGMARHDLFTDYFRFGLFPVSGGGAALSVWALPKAADLSDDIRNGRIPGITDQGTINDYVNGTTPLVLEVGFQPQGKYFGFAQLPDGSGVAETQFDALKLTITFTPPPPVVPPSPVRFEFGGVSVSVVGQVVDVSALDNIFSLSPDDLIEVRMEYAGLRGGLEVMRSIGETPARGASFADRLCTGEGGAGWRNPKITEFAMLLTAPSISEVTVSVDVGDLAGFSSSGDLALTFPELSSSEAAVTDSAIVPLANLNVQTYLFTVSDDGSAAMSAQNNFGSPDAATFLCVRETDAYDSSLHNDLVGVRFHDETFDNDPANFTATGELNESGARTPPQSTTRSAFTITAIAWHYNEADVNLFFPKHVDKGGEPISVRLNDSADSSTYELLATPVNNQPGVLEVVILLKAESTAADDVVLVFETELGDSRLLTVTIPSGSGGTANSEAGVSFTAGSNGTLSASSGGSALTSGDNVVVDGVVLFTATPSSGYYVSAWTGDAAGAGCATGISETDSVDCRIRVPSGGLNVGVSFAEVPPLLVYGAAVSHLGGGRIIAAHGGALLASGAQIEDGDEITLTATPSDGFHLLYWEGDGTASCASGSSQTDAVECEVTADSSGVEVSAFFNDVHESELTALCTAAATSNTDAARIRTVKGYAEGATPDGTGPDVGAVCIFGDSGSPLSDTRTCFAPGDSYRTSHTILYDSTATAGNRDLSAVTFCANDDF